jgi:sulfur carrier protein
MAQKLPEPGKPLMITIILNGNDKQITSNSSIIQLLESLDLSEKRLAVELNQQIVPRSDFAAITLNEQDQVEIVQAIGGGSL